MKNKRRLTMIILGSLLGLCVICGVIVAISPKSQQNPTKAPDTAAPGQQLPTKSEGTSPTLVQPTIASSNTSMPLPTATATLTPLPTATQTMTPLPPATQTAVAVIAKQTQAAIDATSTRQALYDQQTATAEAVNATKTQVAMNKTATAEVLAAYRAATAQAISAQATKIAEYVVLPWQELANYADKYTGQKVKVSGQVFNINNDTELQMWFGSREAIYVVMAEPFSGIYEDSWIIVYGTVQGENCGTNAFGGEVCQPLLVDAFYKIP